MEFLYVAESSNKPIVDIGPGQRCLGGLHRENEKDWSRYTFNELRSLVEDAPRDFVNSLSFGKL